MYTYNQHYHPRIKYKECILFGGVTELPHWFWVPAAVAVLNQFQHGKHLSESLPKPINIFTVESGNEMMVELQYQTDFTASTS